MDSETRFSKRNLSYVAALMLVGLVSMGSTASGANTILELNGGQMDVNGNNIVDGGTTIWDASNGYIPEAQMQTANLVWGDLGIAKTDVNTSNVGLGNVQNEAQVAESGDTMTGTLSVDDIQETDGTVYTSIGLNKDTDSNGNSRDVKIESGGNIKLSTSNVACNIDDSANLNCDGYLTVQGPNAGTLFSVNEDLASQEATLNSQGALRVDAGNDADEDCRIENTGDLTCAGTKSWVHPLNSTHEAKYASQESGEVRAVFEGKAHVVDSKKIELPSHFSKTVSDSDPMLRTQVTPQGTFTKAVAMNKTKDYIQIKVGKETDVNYRVTGIREGYEDKQVVREKE